MKELLSEAESSICWQAAIKGELGRGLKRARTKPFAHLLGMAFEEFGKAVIARRYSQPSYLIMEPDVVEGALRALITPDNQRSWQLAFPDSILLQRTDSYGSLRLFAFVEYKVASDQHLDDLSTQFNGFINFWDYLMQNEGATGKGVLRKHLKYRVPQFTARENPLVYYFVPSDRSGLNIATTLGGMDFFHEIVVPFTVEEISQRIKLVRKNRTKY